MVVFDVEAVPMGRSGSLFLGGARMNEDELEAELRGKREAKRFSNSKGKVGRQE
jgi:hypothetical protein